MCCISTTVWLIVRHLQSICVYALSVCCVFVCVCGRGVWCGVGWYVVRTKKGRQTPTESGDLILFYRQPSLSDTYTHTFLVGVYSHCVSCGYVCGVWSVRVVYVFDLGCS